MDGLLDEVRANEQDLLKQCGAEYIQRIKDRPGALGGRRETRLSPVGDPAFPEKLTANKGGSPYRENSVMDTELSR